MNKICRYNTFSKMAFNSVELALRGRCACKKKSWFCAPNFHTHQVNTMDHFVSLFEQFCKAVVPDVLFQYLLGTEDVHVFSNPKENRKVTKHKQNFKMMNYFLTLENMKKNDKIKVRLLPFYKAFDCIPSWFYSL